MLEEQPVRELRLELLKIFKRGLGRGLKVM